MLRNKKSKTVCFILVFAMVFTMSSSYLAFGNTGGTQSTTTQGVDGTKATTESVKDSIEVVTNQKYDEETNKVAVIIALKSIPDGVAIETVSFAGDTKNYKSDENYEFVVSKNDTYKYEVKYTYNGVENTKSDEVKVIDIKDTETNNNDSNNITQKKSSKAATTKSGEHVAISSVKENTTENPEWEYYNDSVPFSTTVTLEPAGTGGNRIVEVKIDTGIRDALIVESYPKTNSYLTAVTLLDKNGNATSATSGNAVTVRYTVNDNRLAAGTKLSIAYKPAIRTTNYFGVPNSPASAISKSILAEPNMEIKCSVNDTTLNESDDISIKLKKDYDSDNFITKLGVVSCNNASFPILTGEDVDTLKVNTRGFTYLGANSNQNSYALKLNFTNNKHTPVEDMTVKVPIPDGFTTNGCKTDADGDKYVEVKIDVNGNVSGSNLLQNYPYAHYYYGEVTSLNNIATSYRGDMLTGIEPIADQWITIKLTGENSPISLENHISKYTPGLYTADKPITATYNQIEKQTDGTYAKVEKVENFGTMKIDIPETNWVDRFNEKASTPVKVSSEDEDTVIYNTSLTNITTPADAIANDSSRIYENGKITYNIPDEFSPKYMNNGFSGSIKSINYYLKSDPNTPIVVTTGLNGITFNVPENDKVVKVEYNLGEKGISNLLNTSVNFKGKFSAPSGYVSSDPNSPNKINMDVKIEEALPETHSETTTVQWIYEDPIDNLSVNNSVYQATSSGYNSSNPFFLSDFGATTNTCIYSYLRTNTTASSRTYENIDFTLDSKKPQDNGSGTIEYVDDNNTGVETLSGKIQLYTGNTYYSFSGDAYFEYTTTLSSTAKRLSVDTNYNGYRMYDLGLANGEQITSIKFHADKMKLLPGTTNNRTFLQWYVSDNSNIEDGPIVQEINGKQVGYQFTTTATADNFDSNSSGITGEPPAEKEKGTTNLYYMTSRNLELYSGNLSSDAVPATWARGTINASAITIPVPIYETPYLNTSSYPTAYYPKGVKAYLKMDENFRYYGNDSRFSEEKINGERYLVYDFEGLQVANSNNVNITIPAGSIYCAQTTATLTFYNVFKKDECFMDIAALKKVEKTEYPHYLYPINASLLSKMVTDINSITADSGVTDTDKRLVPINTSAESYVVASNEDSIYIFPGVGSKYTYNGANFEADDWNNLSAEITVAHAEKTYIDYKMLLELPQKGKTYTNGKGDSITCKYDMFFKEISIPKEYGGTVKYYSDKERTQEVTDLKYARYAYVAMDKIPAGSEAVIGLKLRTNEDDVYDLSDLDETGLYASSTFYIEDSDSGEKGDTQFEADSVNMGKYIFNYYTVGGNVWMESTSSAPDGIFNAAQGDKAAQLSSSYLNFIDLKDEVGSRKIYSRETYNTSTGAYTLRLPPKKTEYNLTPTLANTSGTSISNTYRLTTQTASANENINNNFPREYTQSGDANTYIHNDGVKFHLDTQTKADGSKDGMRTGQFTTDLDKINLGIYKNPAVAVSASPLNVKVGDTLNFDIVPGFGGKIQDYKQNDSTPTYATFTGTSNTIDASTSSLSVAMKGIEETSKSTNPSYRSGTINAKNYFDDAFTSTSSYRVYKDSYVTFNKGSADATWEQNEDSVERLINSSSHINASNVPKIANAPEGKCFAGWKLTRTGTIVDPTNYTLQKYDVLTAQYEYDNNAITGGDGIPDKYQLGFTFKTTTGGTIGGATKDVNVVKTRFTLAATTELYTDPNKNPANWSTTAIVKLTTDEIPDEKADKYYDFTKWQVTSGPNYENEVALSNYEWPSNITANQVITANFVKNTVNVNLVYSNDPGQKYIYNGTIKKDFEAYLTDEDLQDNSGNALSTPKYGYTFDGWYKYADGTIGDKLVSKDADLKANYQMGIDAPFNENTAITPRFAANEYKVNFTIKKYDKTDNSKLYDKAGNNITEVTANQEVEYLKKGSSLSVPTTAVVDGSSLYKFYRWDYVMDGPDGKGTIKGSTENPKDLEIKGDVTFTAVFIAKSFVTINQSGNGKIFAEQLGSVTNPYSPLTPALTDTAQTIDLSELSLPSDNYNVGMVFKSNANYDVDNIEMKVMTLEGTQTFKVYDENGLQNDNIAAAEKLISTTAGIDAKIAVVPENGNTQGSITVSNVGGKEGDAPACGISVTVNHKLEKRTITFEPNDTKNNIDGQITVAPSGGTIEQGKGVLSVDYGTKGCNLATAASVNKLYSFDHWEIIVDPNDTGKNIKVTPESLANYEFKENTTIRAVYESDTNKDGVPDKYEVTFNYVSSNNEQGTVNGNTKEIIPRPKNTDGTYSQTNAINPTVPPTLLPNENFVFSGWKYTDSEGTEQNKTTDQLKLIKFTESEKTFTATWTRVKWKVSYEVDNENHGFFSEANYENVLIGGNAKNVPTIKERSGYKFIGWTLKNGNNLGTIPDDIVEPASIKVDSDKTFVARLMDEKEVNIDNGLAIIGSGYTIENKDAAGHEDVNVIADSKAKAWRISDGAKATPTAKAEDVGKINNTGKEGGIYTVTLTAADPDNPNLTVSRDIKVIVKGTQTPDPIDVGGDKLAITAKGFTISNSEAVGLTEALAKTKSKVESYLLNNNEEVKNIEADADQLAEIQKASKQGGVYPLKFTATVEKDGETYTNETTVMCVVEGTGTIVEETNDGQHIVITAEGYSLKNDDAQIETENLAKGNSKVKSYMVESSEEITNVSVTDSNITDINNVTDKGGIYDLKWTAKNGNDTASITVKVNVEGLTTPKPTDVDSDKLAITATGFSIANDEASGLDESVAKLKSNVESYLLTSNEKVDNITADNKQIEAINKAEKQGGVYPVTFTATVEKDGKTYTNETTILCVVKGTTTVVKEIGDGLHIVITAEGYTLENAQAKDETETIAKNHSGVKSYLVETGYEVKDISAKASNIDSINKAPKQGGIYDLTLTSGQDVDTTTMRPASVDRYSATTTVKVVVKGINTPNPVVLDPDNPNSDSLAITANGFTVSNSVGKTLTEQKSKILSEVKANLVKSGIEINDISVNDKQLEAIHKVGKAGGIYELTFTAEYNGKTITTTVLVVVKGSNTPNPVAITYGDGTMDYLAINAADFTILYKDAKGLSENRSKIKSDVIAYLTQTNTKVTNITVDKNQLKKIQNCGPEGGKFKLTFTAYSNGKKISVTITVTVVSERSAGTVKKVKTGDNTNMLPWILMLILAGGIEMAALRRKKTK